MVSNTGAGAGGVSNREPAGWDGVYIAYITQTALAYTFLIYQILGNSCCRFRSCTIARVEVG